MTLQRLINESKKHGFGTERKTIKPFTSLDQVWEILNLPGFKELISSDQKFLLFIRKKLFWILSENHHDSYLLIKGIEIGEENAQLVTIVHQILLTYFAEELTFIELSGISLKGDSYNSLTAYQINSKRGTKSIASKN